MNLYLLFPSYVLMGCIVVSLLIAREPGLWWSSVRAIQRQHPDISPALIHFLYYASAAAIWPRLLWSFFAH